MWVKATRCESSACVEVAWHRAAGCESNGCIEVAQRPDVMLVRDSKNLDQVPLQFTRAEWDVFVEGVKDGEFDLA